MENTKNIKKVITRKRATVSGISKVNEGTLKVSVESVLEHPIYHKQQKRHRNYLVVCDKSENFSIGDVVFITPCRKVSKLKSWQIWKESK
jgi:ribosomal protein S17